jgi:exonuclease SbcD
VVHVVRILLLADTHLGYDLPAQPRVQRRRRGHDFLANYATALKPALDGEVDLVVHGGDLFNRSQPHSTVAYQAFEPLIRVAEAGVPVYIVPGNHERGRLPHLRFARHPGIHVFDRPRTFVTDVRGTRLALAGFPSERDDVRTTFSSLIDQTGHRDVAAPLTLLCLHQCVEGATVGPSDYTFTTAPDVIRGRDIPAGFAAVLAGHIHRHQVLTRDLGGRPLEAPVLYPGSIERTSMAECDEVKGFMLVRLSLQSGRPDPAFDIKWEFCPLPARPLLTHDLDLSALDPAELGRRLHELIIAAPHDAVLTLRVRGPIIGIARDLLSSANLRAAAPPTMNVEVRPVAEGPRAEWRRNSSAVKPPQGEVLPPLL